MAEQPACDLTLSYGSGFGRPRASEALSGVEWVPEFKISGVLQSSSRGSKKEVRGDICGRSKSHPAGWEVRCH